MLMQDRVTAAAGPQRRILLIERSSVVTPYLGTMVVTGEAIRSVDMAESRCGSSASSYSYISSTVGAMNSFQRFGLYK
ncbi:hypothetical protein RP20_CCG027009 [Aedes albopictus]|nr:hypothetical protein RP20_CCG027009 [Aedes albopictus]